MRKTKLFTSIAAAYMFSASTSSMAQPTPLQGKELLPTNVSLGECYARVFVPPTYKTITEQVLVKEASERISVEHPVLENTTERVMVKGPSEEWKVIPAQYGWEEETILKAPEHVHPVAVQATYKMESDRIIETPAHSVWKKGTGPIQKIDNATGEIMCLVEQPATYKDFQRQAVDKEAYVREEIHPAVYETVKRRVMISPPRIEKVEIPAEYKTITVRKQVNAANIVRTPIPAEYSTLTKKVQLTEGRMEWEQILCETNTTPDVIRKLQSNLNDRGYNPGTIDGVLGQQTMEAVKVYQKDKGLPVGPLTIETLKRLEVL